MRMTAVKHQGFPLIARKGLKWLECRRLARIPWVRHAFSTRVLHQNSRQSRAGGISQMLLDHLGVGTLPVADLRQIHSSLVYRVWSSSGGLNYCPSSYTPAHKGSGSLPCGDALLSNEPGILLSVRTADCVPILLVDPSRHTVGAVHAGWRGSLERVAEKTVDEMRRMFHSQPEELLAAIGPSIRSCCYEVGQEVVEAFRGRFTRCEAYFKQPSADDTSQAPALRYPLPFFSMKPPGGTAAAHLDLVAVTRDQLQNAGLRSAHIYVADFCTACRTDLFFSHRKEGTTGRMMAVIGMT